MQNDVMISFPATPHVLMFSCTATIFTRRIETTNQRDGYFPFLEISIRGFFYK